MQLLISGVRVETHPRIILLAQKDQKNRFFCDIHHTINIKKMELHQLWVCNNCVTVGVRGRLKCAVLWRQGRVSQYPVYARYYETPTPGPWSNDH
jgi:hypothetical protein